MGLGAGIGTGAGAHNLHTPLASAISTLFFLILYLLSTRRISKDTVLTIRNMHKCGEVEVKSSHHHSIPPFSVTLTAQIQGREITFQNAL